MILSKLQGQQCLHLNKALMNEKKGSKANLDELSC